MTNAHIHDELELQPHTEGRTHIRMSIESRSRLGRLLSNEAHTPFLMETHGSFASMEAFWAYMKRGATEDDFGLKVGNIRDLYGEAALRATMRSAIKPLKGFRLAVCMGLECKIEQNEELQQLLIDNTLELVRYDIIDNEAMIITSQTWFNDHLAKLVKRLKCRKRT